MSARTASIHFLSPDSGDCFLTAAEEKRASSFRFPEDSVRWSAWRSGLRRILGKTIGVSPEKVPLIFGEFGKPALAAPFESLHFSLCHCTELALVALCDAGPVGVDLEPLARAPDLLGCEKTFCHPAEIETLPTEPGARAFALLEFWTAKEALLKALGTGFSHPPDKVRIHCRPSGSIATSETPLVGITAQLIHRLYHPRLAEHCAALSVPETVSLIDIVPPE